MNITQALRIARSEFDPVRRQATLYSARQSALWFYETGAPGGRSCASRDYYAVVRKKNVEVVRYALVLLGWSEKAAREYVTTIDGRGTQYEMILAARDWRVEEGKRRVA